MGTWAWTLWGTLGMDVVGGRLLQEYPMGVVPPPGVPYGGWYPLSTPDGGGTLSVHLMGGWYLLPWAWGVVPPTLGMGVVPLEYLMGVVPLEYPMGVGTS